MTTEQKIIRGKVGLLELAKQLESFGYCGAQDTCYVGTLKGVGRIYQQTFIDTYSKVGFAKLYTEMTPITAADLLNDRVRPLFEGPRSRRRASAPSGRKPTASVNASTRPC